jgi:hypothetical protein
MEDLRKKATGCRLQAAGPLKSYKRNPDCKLQAAGYRLQENLKTEQG